MSIFVKITGSILLASGDFFCVFENVVPELRGHIEGGGDATFAGGFIGFGQHVVEQHGHTLVFTALDVHRLRAVAQPRFGYTEYAADVRDGAVTWFAVTGFNYSNKVSGKSELVGKLLLRQFGGKANLLNSISHFFLTSCFCICRVAQKVYTVNINLKNAKN